MHLSFKFCKKIKSGVISQNYNNTVFLIFIHVFTFTGKLYIFVWLQVSV